MKETGQVGLGRGWGGAGDGGSPEGGLRLGDGSKVCLHGGAGRALGCLGSVQGCGAVHSLCSRSPLQALGAECLHVLLLGLHHPGHKARLGEKTSSSMCHSFVFFFDSPMPAAAEIGHASLSSSPENCHCTDV